MQYRTLVHLQAVDNIHHSRRSICDTRPSLERILLSKSKCVIRNERIDVQIFLDFGHICIQIEWFYRFQYSLITKH
jgi:hypothetical protein